MAFKSTSIKGSNVAILDQSGKIGTVRYFIRNGQTYVRCAKNKTTAASNPRTDAQMEQRLKHASLVAIWKKFSPYMSGAFQNKESNQSDYNAFIQQNAGLGIYLTKQQYASGMGIALPVAVSSGSLPALDGTVDGGKYMCPLAHSVQSTDTIGDFSLSVISKNEGWLDGDTVTAFILSQDANDKLVLSVRQLVLDVTSDQVLSSTGFEFGPSTFGISLGAVSGYCVGLVHGSSAGMSPCVLCNGNETKIAEYSTQLKFRTARDSYGTARKLFLKNGTTAEVATHVVSATPTPSNSGTFTGTGAYPEGSVVTVTAVPATGYVFSKWSDGITTAARLVTVNGDVELNAVFRVDE